MVEKKLNRDSLLCQSFTSQSMPKNYSRRQRSSQYYQALRSPFSPSFSWKALLLRHPTPRFSSALKMMANLHLLKPWLRSSTPPQFQLSALFSAVNMMVETLFLLHTLMKTSTALSQPSTPLFCPQYNVPAENEVENCWKFDFTEAMAEKELSFWYNRPNIQALGCEELLQLERELFGSTDRCS